MLSYVKKPYCRRKILSLFEPPVREWFRRTFKDFTLPQKLAIFPIYKGENVLITGPTGSGKSLAAFAVIINEIIKLSHLNTLKNQVYCIYISPLRALDRDIHKNLLIPIKEIEEIAEKMNYALHQEIKINVRTGDTTSYEKQKMLKSSPAILITTPESIAIVLSTRKFKEKLKNVKWVIIDEIHELADSKRGVHLSLSLERLQHLVGKPFVRIGAGATLEPLIDCAKFLVGYENEKERDCKIIDARFVKKMDIKLLSPTKDLLHTSAEATTGAMYSLLNKLISKHKTTLVFTNTRSGTERVVHYLKQRFPEVYSDELIGAHHSSVSREIRHEVEDKLKRGELKCVCSSTSLELGVDIGYIDLVTQLGSPKSITRLVQRIGRGGHTLEKTSVGRVIAMDRDDQVELAVMIQQAYNYFLDKVQIPQNCLDVLAQHLMGMSLEKKWNVKEAFNLIRNSYCYRNLDWNTFLSVLEFLSGAYHSLEEKKVYSKIWFDPRDMMFGRRGKYARVIYSLNIGTIPDEVKIKVRTLDGRYIGSIEEEFLQRLLPGDIFVLAGKTYEFVRAKQVTAFVNPVKEKRPTVPAWFSEMLPLSFELALKIQEFRGKMFSLLKKKSKEEIINWLLKNYYLDGWSANSIYEYFLWQYKFLKSLGAKRFPDEKTILVENYVDVKGNQNLIFHTLFGRRINDALSRAFGYLLTKKLKKSVGLTISDNGFVISIPCESLGKGWIDIASLRERIKRREVEKVNPENIVKLLRAENLEEILRKALRQTELIKRRFRHCATRSLMILRNYKGYEIKVARQQLNADRLLRVCEKFENFPVVEETYREIMKDFMDVEHAKLLLKQIEDEKIKYEFLPESNAPSPFAHNLIALGESDVVLMEDRKRLLLELHKKVAQLLKNSLS